MSSTRDLWLASFIIGEGHELSSYEVLANRRVKFKFDLDDGTWQELKIKYTNSDLSKYKQIQQKLRDLIY